MNKNLNKKIVQCMALILSTLVILGGFVWVNALIQSSLEHLYFQLFFIFLLMIFTSAILWASYQILSDYSVKAIESFSAVLSFVILGQIVFFFNQPLIDISESNDPILVIPIIALVWILKRLIYRFLLFLLKSLTLEEK